MSISSCLFVRFFVMVTKALLFMYFVFPILIPEPFIATAHRSICQISWRAFHWRRSTSLVRLSRIVRIWHILPHLKVLISRRLMTQCKAAFHLLWDKGQEKYIYIYTHLYRPNTKQLPNKLRGSIKLPNLHWVCAWLTNQEEWHAIPTRHEAQYAFLITFLTKWTWHPLWGLH